MFRKALLTTAAAVAMLALSSVARADVTLLGVCSPDGTNQCSKSLTLSSNGLLTITLVNTTTGNGAASTYITADGFNLPSGVGIFDPAGSATFQFTSTSNTFQFYTAGPFNFPNAEGAGAANFLISAQGPDGTGGGNPSGGIRGGCAANNLAPCTATFTVRLTGVNALNEAQVAMAIFNSEVIRARGDLGSDVDVPGNPNNPIPEPMTMLLFGTGLAGVAAKVRRRRKA